MDIISENHERGVIFDVRIGRDQPDLKYFCDHVLLDGYNGLLSPAGNFFTEDTLCDMMELLEEEDYSNYRYNTSKDDGDRFIESIIMDFVYTFGRKSVPGDIMVANMKSSVFGFVEEEEEEESLE